MSGIAYFTLLYKFVYFYHHVVFENCTFTATSIDLIVAILDLVVVVKKYASDVTASDITFCFHTYG